MTVHRCLKVVLIPFISFQRCTNDKNCVDEKLKTILESKFHLNDSESNSVSGTNQQPLRKIYLKAIIPQSSTAVYRLYDPLEGDSKQTYSKPSTSYENGETISISSSPSPVEMAPTFIGEPFTIIPSFQKLEVNLETEQKVVIEEKLAQELVDKVQQMYEHNLKKKRLSFKRVRNFKQIFC